MNTTTKEESKSQDKIILLIKDRRVNKVTSN